jgi:hypothetical protein
MLQTARQITTAQTRLARWVGTAADQPLAPAPSFNRLLFGLGDLMTRIEEHPRVDSGDKRSQVSGSILSHWF